MTRNPKGNHLINPIKPDLFSPSPGRGGGTQRPGCQKSRLPSTDWNETLHESFIAIKACLMQNLSVVAFLFLEIWRRKITLWRRERVIKFGYLPPENEFNFRKSEFLCPESFFSTQNWLPLSISAIVKQRKIFHFQNFRDVSMRKEQQQPTDWSILLKFGQNMS